MLVLPSWPTLQGLNSGRGSDLLPASDPVASGWGVLPLFWLPFSCPVGASAPSGAAAEGRSVLQAQRRKAGLASCSVCQQQPGARAWGRWRGGTATHRQSQHGPILCSAVGRTLDLPQGNWAPHPRTSLETAEGRAGRLAPWQLELASQPTPPTNTHTHTEETSIKAGCRQASQAPSFLQACLSTLISGFCEMRQEWRGRAGGMKRGRL